MNIKQTTPPDHDTLIHIHESAFGPKAGPVIATLVADLFKDPSADPVLSLGARDDQGLMGHILFTRAVIKGAEIPVSASLLAPLAILPHAQGLGVGQALIREGLRQLEACGTDLVFVLGHPGYYPRAGFSPAGVHGFSAPYPIPEKDAGAWMVHELRSGMLGRVSGQVKCADALDRPEHWRE